MLQYVFATLAALSTFVSGLVPLRSNRFAFSTRYAVAFASGIVIATAFFDLLPQLSTSTHFLTLGLGFFLFYGLEKSLMIHACGEAECESHSMSWVGVTGMSFDNIVDGVGIAVSYLTDPTLGAVVTAAVIAHEIPQDYTATRIMRDAAYSHRRILLVIAAAAVFYPLGALIATFLPTDWYVAAIALVAGDFIYVGASDLLPEAHKRFNFKVVGSVLLGLLLVLALEAFGV